MRWELAAEDPAQVQCLAAALSDLPDLRFAGRAANGTSRGDPIPTLARLLVRRGMPDADSAARFLFPSSAHLHAPER